MLFSYIYNISMNTKFLAPVSSNANDLEALTPNHFLVGKFLPYLPCAEEFVNHRKNFPQT